MTEHEPIYSRLEDLLAQDSQVPSFPFEEFRMNLQISIQELEQKANKIRIACYWGLAATIVCIFLPYLMYVLLVLAGMSEIMSLFKLGWMYEVGVIFSSIAFWTTGILTCFYWFKYKPAIDRAKNDLQTTILAQLQAQVAELSRKIDIQSKS